MIFLKKATHLQLGERGERIVCREMRRKGLTVLRRNYSVHATGEIDIIGRDGSCLVFVEVKTRKSEEGARPGEAVNYDKKIRLWKTAHCFIKEIGGHNLRYRFDVAEVYYKSFFRSRVIYLPSAFDMDHVQKRLRAQSYQQIVK